MKKCLVLLRVAKVHRSSIIDWIKKHPDVRKVYETNHSYDVFIEIEPNTFQEYNSWLRELNMQLGMITAIKLQIDSEWNPEDDKHNKRQEARRLRRGIEDTLPG